jgi:hypothetical protein
MSFNLTRDGYKTNLKTSKLMSFSKAIYRPQISKLNKF